MKLAIISHTDHYKISDGSVVGWGPTINEINHLLDVFDEIYHVAMLHKGEAPKSALPYTSDKVKFVELPLVGGPHIKDKINIILKAPRIIRVVSSVLKKVDYFQLRTPTGIGVLLIPYLTLFVNRKGWFKYAGNWNQKNAPLGYAFQRWVLRHQSRKVTINGAWPNQPKHCLTFENPCLTVIDLEQGNQIMESKSLQDGWSFCYAGRLETEKGVMRIIKAFTNLTVLEKKRINKVHLVGDGLEIDDFKELAFKSDVNFIFHGFLAREKVFDIYKSSHVFIMPTTASEGFPKAIAEAMNFGCIPVVSNISSISQYVKHNSNGLLIEPVTVDTIVRNIGMVLKLTTKEYFTFANNRDIIVNKFAFEYYNRRIIKDIINIE